MSDPAILSTASTSSTSSDYEEEDGAAQSALDILTLKDKKGKHKGPKDFHSMNLSTLHSKSTENHRKSHQPTDGEDIMKKVDASRLGLSPPGTARSGSARSGMGASFSVNSNTTKDGMPTHIPMGRHGSTIRLDGSPMPKSDVASSSTRRQPSAPTTTSSRSASGKKRDIGDDAVFAKSFGESRDALLGNITSHVKEAGNSIKTTVERTDSMISLSRRGSVLRQGSRRSLSKTREDSQQPPSSPEGTGSKFLEGGEEVDGDSNPFSDEEDTDSELDNCPNYLKGYERQQRMYRQEDLTGLSPLERVRRRLQLQRRLQEVEGQALLERTAERAQVAEMKRQFQESVHKQQVNGMWATVLYITLSAQRLQNMLWSAKALRVLKYRLLPMMYLKGHRLIRRSRLKTFSHLLVRPGFEVIRKDKIMSLFPEEQLMPILAELKPQFFVAGDVLVYQGGGGSDCFIINSGNVSITVDGKNVATLTAGAVIGTPGMVSGEPRMATVRALSDVTVWVGSKGSFDRAVSQSHSGSHLRKAFEVIAEMHILNIPLLYKKALRADGLARFAAFGTVKKDCLNAIGSKFNAMFVSEGDVVVATKTRAFTGYYILHGSVSVDIPIPSGMSVERAYYTALRIACDIYQTKKKHRSVLFEAIASQLERRTKINEPFTVTLRRIGSPVLFGVPNLLFGHPYELSVRAECGVDAMVLKRDALVDGLLEDPVALNTSRRLANITRLGHFSHWYLSSQFPRGDPLTLQGATSTNSQSVEPNISFVAIKSSLFTSNGAYDESGGGGQPFENDNSQHKAKSTIPIPNANGSRYLNVSEGVNPDDSFMISRGTLDVDHHGSVGTHPYMWPSLHETYYGGFTGSAQVCTRDMICVRVKRKDVHRAIDTLHTDDRTQMMSILDSAILSGQRGCMTVPDVKEFWVPESKAAIAAKASSQAAATAANTPLKKAGSSRSTVHQTASGGDVGVKPSLSNASFTSATASISNKSYASRRRHHQSTTVDNSDLGTIPAYSPTHSPTPQGNVSAGVKSSHIPVEGSTLTPVTSFRRRTALALEGAEDGGNGDGLILRHGSTLSDDTTTMSRKSSMAAPSSSPNMVTSGSSNNLLRSLGRKVSFKGGRESVSSVTMAMGGVAPPPPEVVPTQSSQGSDSVSTDQAGEVVTNTKHTPRPPRNSVLDDALMLKLTTKAERDQKKAAEPPSSKFNKLEVHDHLGRKVTGTDLVRDGTLTVPRFTPRRRGLTERRSEDTLLMQLGNTLGQELKKNPISGKAVVFTDNELSEIMRDHVPTQSPYSFENMALAQMRAKKEGRRPVYAPGGGANATIDNLPRRPLAYEPIDAAVERIRNRSPPKNNRATSPLQLIRGAERALPGWLSDTTNLDHTFSSPPRPSSPPPIGVRKITDADLKYVGPARIAKQQGGGSTEDDPLSLSSRIETGLPSSPSSTSKVGAPQRGGGFVTKPALASSGRRKEVVPSYVQTGLLTGSVLGDALNRDTKRDRDQAMSNQFQNNRSAFLDLTKCTTKVDVSHSHSFAGSIMGQNSSSTLRQQQQPQTARSMPTRTSGGGSSLTPRAPPVAGRRAGAAAPSWMPPATFVASRM